MKRWKVKVAITGSGKVRDVVEGLVRRSAINPRHQRAALAVWDDLPSIVLRSSCAGLGVVHRCGADGSHRRGTIGLQLEKGEAGGVDAASDSVVTVERSRAGSR